MIFDLYIPRIVLYAVGPGNNGHPRTDQKYYYVQALASLLCQNRMCRFNFGGIAFPSRLIVTIKILF